MKCKVIPAAAHNFTHSFMGVMSYVNGQDLIKVLRDLTWNSPDRTLSIYWLSALPVVTLQVPPIVEEVIISYRSRLPEHFSRHHVPLTALRSFQTVLWYGTRPVLLGRADVIDDRGRHYTKRVILRVSSTPEVTDRDAE